MSWGTMQEKYTKACMRMLVYRYLYYVCSYSAISDAEYDDMERKLRKVEEMYPQLAHPKSPTKVVGSDNPLDYPRSVRWHCERNIMGREVDHDGLVIMPVEEVSGEVVPRLAHRGRYSFRSGESEHGMAT